MNATIFAFRNSIAITFKQGKKVEKIFLHVLPQTLVNQIQIKVDCSCNVGFALCLNCFYVNVVHV